MDEYHDLMIDLAVAIMQVLAQTLDLDQSVFADLRDHPASILRLLHYPPQEGNTDLERGETHSQWSWIVLISHRDRGTHGFWGCDYAPTG